MGDSQQRTAGGPHARWYVVGAIAVVLLGVLVVTWTRSAQPGPGTGPAAAPLPPPVTVPDPPAPTSFLYVDPAGADGNDGSRGAPLRTIQAALDRATPGTQITLAPGVYRERLQTTRAGEPGAPIRIQGPETGTDRAGRYRAVLYGTGRVLSIDHSHYVLDGFTIDGQEKLSGVAFPTDLAGIDTWKASVQDDVADGRLVYVGAADDSRDITGVQIRNMFLSGAGGECVRLRNNAHDNAVVDSVIQYCGLYGKGDGDERATFHNGEGVYIGTSPNSDSQPMYDNDTSSGNLVVGNTIRTFGSECFDVKENARANVFQGNTCSDNTESAEFDGSNVELRGQDNVVRDNTITGSAGFGVKIAADDDHDPSGNVVADNRIADSAVALKVETASVQGRICGNTAQSRTLVESDEDDHDPGDITAPC